MFRLADYADLINDRVRTEAYAQALRQTVNPGSTVLEIGTGPGIFAILAAQLGAGRVVAIETQGIIQSASENADANGCSDRIEFIEGLSTSVNLPLQADVIVSDLHGVLPLFDGHIPSIIDARRRFLRPGGILIPREESLWATVVEMPDFYGAIIDPWEKNLLNIKLAATGRLALNNVQKARPKPQELLAAPQLWATLNYHSIEHGDVRGDLRWIIDRDGIGHGVVVWFNSNLADGISFSNAPGSPETIYGSLFFPWTHPVQLRERQAIRMDLQATSADGDYVWRWKTEFGSLAGSEQTGVVFDQSTVAGAMLSHTNLRKLAASHVPVLSSEGNLNYEVLHRMDGKTTLEVIARSLAAAHPAQFPRWQDALKIAGAISRKFSE